MKTRPGDRKRAKTSLSDQKWLKTRDNYRKWMLALKTRSWPRKRQSGRLGKLVLYQIRVVVLKAGDSSQKTRKRVLVVETGRLEFENSPEMAALVALVSVLVSVSGSLSLVPYLCFCLC
jgi:hypothetical protein